MGVLILKDSYLVKIRVADINDLEDITEIYNYAILKTNATFDTESKTVGEMRKWFEEHDERNTIIVAELDEEIVGWAALSKYDKKPAYSRTAEISLYVKQEFQGKGIGKQLIKRIIEEGKKAGLHAIVARITKGNKISVHLHKEFGFKKVGVLKDVGFKFGKYLDVYIMEKILE